MSQAGIVDFEASHPQVPTMFVTDSGPAMPIANTLEILATTVAAHSIPIETTGSGNVVTVVAQYSSSSASSVAAKAGFASFDSSVFTVDANGFVTIGSTVFAKTITGNDGTPEAPVAGNWNIVTANATAKFAGTAGTETLDFSLDTLLLGSSGASLTGGAVRNAGFGQNALLRLTSGTDNTSSGSNSSLNLTTGQSNSIYGSQIFQAATSASFNVAIGDLSLNGLHTGSYNLCLGYTSGGSYSTSESSNITLLNSGTVGESNTIRIGTSGSGNGQQNRCFIAGIDGVNVGSVAKVVTETGDQLGTATITAGTGISVVASANTITINAVGEGMTWSVVTGASQAMSVNHGYIANNAGTVAFTLPTTSAVGDTITVTGMNNATGWSIGYTTNQQIFFGTSSATLTSGSLASTATRDTVTLVCIVANLTWNVISSIGNITVA